MCIGPCCSPPAVTPGSARIDEDVAGHVSTFQARLQELQGLKLGTGIDAALAATQQDLRAYIDSATRMSKLAFNDLAQAQGQLAEFNQRFKALEGPMSTLSDRIAGLAETEQEEAESAAHQVTWVLALTSVVATLLLLGLNMWMSRHMLRSLLSAVRVSKQVARGDLSVRIAVQNHDEKGSFWVTCSKWCRTLAASLPGCAKVPRPLPTARPTSPAAAWT